MDPFSRSVNYSGDPERRLAIHFAALLGKPLLFKNLLMHKADFFAVDARNQNILHFACKGGDAQMVASILYHYNKISDDPKWLTCSQNLYTGIDNLYPVQIQCSSCGKVVWSQIRVHRECLHVFQVKYKEDKRFPEMGRFGEIENHCTNGKGSHNPKDGLNSYKECLTNIPSSGEHMRRDLTPLMVAILTKNDHLLPLLLDQYSYSGLEIMDSFGYTALQHACIMGSLKSIKLLRMQGAKDRVDYLHPKCPMTCANCNYTSSPKSSMELAIINGHTDIVHFLQGKVLMLQIKKLVRE